MCYFLVSVSVNLEGVVKVSFSQMLLQSNSCFGVNLSYVLAKCPKFLPEICSK